MTDQVEEKEYKNDGFAHTSWEIPKREFNFNDHEWMQEGTLIICQSCPKSHSSSIPVDKMLVKEGAEYSIVPIRMLS